MLFCIFSKNPKTFLSKTVTTDDIRANTKLFGDFGAFDMLGVIKYSGEIVNDINSTVDQIIRENEEVNRATEKANVGTQMQTEATANAPETATAPTVTKTATEQTLNVPIKNAPKTPQIQMEGINPFVNTQTEATAVGIQNDGIESASNDGKQYASATINGKSVLLATESAQNEKASANAEVKRSLSKTKVEKLKEDIRKLGEKRITKDAGGKKITILTDYFTEEKNIFSQSGRKDEGFCE